MVWNTSEYLRQTSIVPHAFLLLIATNLALTGCLGWKWSLWPVPDWLAVQRSKAVFFVTLNHRINDMKQFKLSVSHFSCATVIFVVDCCQFWPSMDFCDEIELMACAALVCGTTEQSWFFHDLIWYYQWYERLPNCHHRTSAVPQPFLLLIAANLAYAGYLGWKWSSWPVLTWLAVQSRKYVFFLILYDNNNDMKHFWTVFITPQQCHSHVCCWFLSIWSQLDFLAENGAYGLRWLCWRYNGSKLYFSSPYMIVSIL